MSLAKLSILAGLALILCGCAEDETPMRERGPLETIRSERISARYQSDWWGKQAKEETRLFIEAMTFCEGAPRGEYPNCAHVRPAIRLWKMKEAVDQAPDADSFSSDLFEMKSPR